MNLKKRSPKKLVSKILSICFAGALLCAGVFPFIPKSDKVSADGEMTSYPASMNDVKFFNPYEGAIVSHRISRNNFVSETIPGLFYCDHNNFYTYSNQVYRNSSWIFSNYLEYDDDFSYYISRTNTWSTTIPTSDGKTGYPLYEISIKNAIVPLSFFSSLSIAYEYKSSRAFENVDNSVYFALSYEGILQGKYGNPVRILQDSGPSSLVYERIITTDLQSGFVYPLSRLVGNSNIPSFNINGVDLVYIDYFNITFLVSVPFRITNEPILTQSFVSLFVLDEDFYSVYSSAVSSYISGLRTQADKDNINVIFDAILGMVNSLLNFEIFPNFRFSYIIMLGVGAVVFGFVLKMFMGG